MCISGFDTLFEKYYSVFGPVNEKLDELYTEKKNTHFRYFKSDS